MTGDRGGDRSTAEDGTAGDVSAAEDRTAGDRPTPEDGAADRSTAPEDGATDRSAPGAPAGALALRGVRREYGPVVALDGVDLAVPGEGVHLLVGPNGSGKSTALRLLLGLARPTDGRVDRPDATVGAGFQRPAFYPDLTVGENLGVFAALEDVPAAWRGELVDRLGLGRVEDRRAGALSGGYAKKLDLALALLGRPDYLLLDEPLGDLDGVTRDAVRSLLSTYRADHGVLVSTHRVAAFEPLAERVTVLDRGSVRFAADGAELAAAIDEAGSLSALYRSVLAEEPTE